MDKEELIIKLTGIIDCYAEGIQSNYDIVQDEVGDSLLITREGMLGAATEIIEYLDFRGKLC